MKPSDFNKVFFYEHEEVEELDDLNEEELEIWFEYRGNDYSLVISFDDEGYLLPTFFHETKEKDLYKCYHCSPYIKPKEVRGKGVYYSISPHSHECMYLNPIADKVMKMLFQNDKIKDETKHLINKIK